jgi:hypothetical protein
MPLPDSSTISRLSHEYIVPTWYPGALATAAGETRLDQFIRKLPLKRVERPGEKFHWNRAASLPAVQVYTVYPATALPANPMNTVDLVADFFRLGDTCEIDAFQETAASNVIDQLAVQVEAKKVGIIRALGDLALNGPGGSAFAGLAAYYPIFPTPSPNTISVTGSGLPTLDDLHRLVYRVTASDGSVGAGPTCLVASTRVIRFIIKLLEAAPGRRAEYVFDPEIGGPVALFNGIPFYAGQNAENEVITEGGLPQFTSIWALKLAGPTSIALLHSTGASSEFGIEVMDVPLRQGGTSIQGKLVAGHYGLLLPEVHSAARLVGTDVTVLPAY